jgi:hypothetical protein
MSDFTLKSKKCLEQAKAFRTRAAVNALEGIKLALEKNAEEADERFERAHTFLRLMDDAKDAALVLSPESEEEYDVPF